jgi:polysaccharide export outer membrane protein
VASFYFGGVVRQLLIALGVIAMAGGVSACGGASRGGPVPYPSDVAQFKAPDLDRLTPSAGQHRISPLDKLRINVFQVAELSGEFTVDAQGKIQFPLIGEVVAQGLLPEELQQLIARRLGERYLQSPNVQVAVTEQQQQIIHVDGSVRAPGQLPIRGTTTLMRAVAQAQGFAADANPARVVVFRTINGQRMAAAFDMRAIRRAQAEDPVIYGNDIIIVDGQRNVWREVLTAIPLLGYFAPFIP